jgi:hypothetical protein
MLWELCIQGAGEAHGLLQRRRRQYIERVVTATKMAFFDHVRQRVIDCNLYACALERVVFNTDVLIRNMPANSSCDFMPADRSAK